MGDRLSVREGESATINCGATAFPPEINYTLTNSGTPITLAADNSHTIESTMMEDAGTYTCTATNEVDTSELNVILEVGSPPGQVSNIMVDDNEDDITISWDPAEDYGEGISRYNIVLSYDGIEKELSVDGSTTSTTVTKEKLRELFSKSGDVMVTLTITAENNFGEGEPATETAALQLPQDNGLPQDSGALPELSHLLLSTLLVIFAYLIVF